MSDGRIAGVDFGTVRIGIALSDRQRAIASPHVNYTRRDEAQDAAFFRHLVDEEEVCRFVVGLPVHLDGHESQKSAEARPVGSTHAAIRFNADWVGTAVFVVLDWHRVLKVASSETPCMTCRFSGLTQRIAVASQFGLEAVGGGRNAADVRIMSNHPETGLTPPLPGAPARVGPA